jgi:hypothetical protein
MTVGHKVTGGMGQCYCINMNKPLYFLVTGGSLLTAPKDL